MALIKAAGRRIFGHFVSPSRRAGRRLRRSAFAPAQSVQQVVCLSPVSRGSLSHRLNRVIDPGVSPRASASRSSACPRGLPQGRWRGCRECRPDRWCEQRRSFAPDGLSAKSTQIRSGASRPREVVGVVIHCFSPDGGKAGILDVGHIALFSTSNSGPGLRLFLGLAMIPMHCSTASFWPRRSSLSRAALAAGAQC